MPLFYIITLLHFYILLYQATESHTKFVIHAEGKSLYAEILVNLQRAEVRAQRSVFPAGDNTGVRNDVLTDSLICSPKMRIEKRKSARLPFLRDSPIVTPGFLAL